MLRPLPWRRTRSLRVEGDPSGEASIGDVRATAVGETAVAEIPPQGGRLDVAGGAPFVLRVDGGSRGNPGPAAIGVVLEDTHGTVVETMGVRIGTATNNVAEYQSLITGLEIALDHGVRRLRVLSDSELLVKQLRSEYKVRAEALKDLFLQARSLLQRFERVDLAHVPREENVAADRLVNQALDGTI